MSQKLDPSNQIFQGRFGNESLVFESGEYIKDLSYLNRDLKKVIIIDKDPRYLKKQPNNAIYLSEFKGDMADNELYELLPFLECKKGFLGGWSFLDLAKPEVKDVQQEIVKYGNHNP